MSFESGSSSRGGGKTDAPGQEKKRAVFLDRDGTLIEEKNYLTNFNDVQLIEDAVESVHRINHARFIPIVVSNQSVVARGLISLEGLEEIHRLIDREFRLNGARIEDFFFCPHHPEGTVEEFSIECECRKPKPGLLLQAAERWNIDLSGSFMVGDSSGDIEAGKAAGCRTILVGDAPVSQEPDFRAETLLDAVNWILEQ